MKNRLLASHLALIILLIAAGCNMPAGGAGPRTWIDAPLDGMTVPLAPVVVRSHAAAEGGTAQASLWVDGAQVRVDSAADGSASLIEFAQAWTPPGPGEYRLQVISTDHSGNEGRSNTVRVIVGGEPSATPVAATETPVTGTPATPTVTSTVAPNAPSFRFDVPGNCRLGPDTVYEVVTSFLAGQQLPIAGRNADNSWFWLLMPDGGHCWAAASTGTAQGPYAEADVIQSPAPPVITTEAPPPQEATTEAPPPPPVEPPPAPAGLSINELVCTSEEYTVRLSWKDVAGEQGYRVYRDGALIMNLGADATQYDDTPGNYESHGYRVEAWNGSGANSTGVKNSTGCVF